MCARIPTASRTMLSNLVSNSLKYSAPGSDITVIVRDEPGWVAVDVIDHGIGISEEEMAKLFQPFGRLDSALSAGIQGHGPRPAPVAQPGPVARG